MARVFFLAGVGDQETGLHGRGQDPFACVRRSTCDLPALPATSDHVSDPLLPPFPNPLDRHCCAGRATARTGKTPHPRARLAPDGGSARTTSPPARGRGPRPRRWSARCAGEGCSFRPAARRANGPRTLQRGAGMPSWRPHWRGWRGAASGRRRAVSDWRSAANDWRRQNLGAPYLRRPAA